MEMLEIGFRGIDKKMHLLWIGNSWLLTGYPSTDGKFLADNAENTVISAVCSCDQCFESLIGPHFLSKAYKVGVRKLLLDVVHDHYLSSAQEVREKLGGTVEIACVSKETLPENFSILPSIHKRPDLPWDRGTCRFRTRSEMIKWIITTRCYQSADLLQIDGYRNVCKIRLEPFIEWLEELGKVEASFDPMRFIGRLHTEVMGKPISEVNIRAMLDEMC